jgi:proline iminopeptidase
VTSINNTNVLKNSEDYLDVPGGKIWYQKFFSERSQDKIPIIVLHGGPGVPHNYLRKLSQLAVNNPVVFYDQLGCGKSAINGNHKELWLLPHFVEELELLINQLGASEIYLLGHSSGAALAIEYALKNPHQVKKLILASPFISASLWIKDTRYLLEQLPPQVVEVINKHEKEGTLESQEYQDATLIFYHHFLCRMPEWPDDFKDSFSNLNLSVYQTMWGPSEFSLTGNLKKFERLNDLQLLKIHTLITCGRFDEARPESMQKIVNLLPNGELVIFENSAHIPHLEESEKYLKAITEFLEAGVYP